MGTRGEGGPGLRRCVRRALGGVLVATFGVLAAGASPAEPRRDLAIDDVVAPVEASLGDVLAFNATIENQVQDGLRTTLTLLEEGRQVRKRDVILRRGENHVSIATIPETEGVRRFRLELPLLPDEASQENNVADVAVRVVKRVLKVLLIAGAPSREYYFLVPALLRDPVITLSAYLQSADVDYVQQGSQSIDRLPATPREWDEFDVVILLDVDPEGLTVRQVEGLENLVRKGGGLAVVAGRRQGLARMTKNHPKLQALLPVRIAAETDTPDYDRLFDAPFKVQRTAFGKQHPLFVSSPDAAVNEGVWKALEGAPFYWHHPVEGTRPGAAVLVERAVAGDERASCLMAIQRYGEGAVFFSGLDTLWRWRYPFQDYDYDRFWNRLIRYLGETRFLGAQMQVSLAVDKRRYILGEDVHIILNVLDPALLQALEGKEVHAEVTAPDGSRWVVRLEKAPGGTPRYRGVYHPRRVGDMRVRVRYVHPEAGPDDKPLFDVQAAFQVKAPAASRVPGQRGGLQLAALGGSDSDAPVLLAATAPPESEAERLPATMERERGPTFPGRNPAFLVLPRRAERPAWPQELLTPEVRQMTDRALQYLVGVQKEDGCWSDTQYPSNTGVTGLACLALMAEGSQPRAGKYGKALDRGLEFLLRNAGPSGAIATKTSNPLGPMYEQCYATLALLQAYGEMPWQRELRDVIARSLQLIERSQKLDGGWRYNFIREGDSDACVTSHVLWVLRTAKKSGFTVSAEKVQKAVAFLERCAMPEGGFRYRIDGPKMAPSMAGAGILVLCRDGTLQHPFIALARDSIAADYRRFTVADLKERRYTVFNTFFAGLGLYPCGDESWVPWYRKVATLYTAMQRRDGEFLDEKENALYPTAMAAIVLQAPLGYLPLFER